MATCHLLLYCCVFLYFLLLANKLGVVGYFENGKNMATVTMEDE